MLSTNKLIKPLLILILIGLAVYFAPIVIFKGAISTALNAKLNDLENSGFSISYEKFDFNLFTGDFRLHNVRFNFTQFGDSTIYGHTRRIELRGLKIRKLLNENFVSAKSLTFVAPVIHQVEGNEKHRAIFTSRKGEKINGLYFENLEINEGVWDRKTNGKLLISNMELGRLNLMNLKILQPGSESFRLLYEQIAIRRLSIDFPENFYRLDFPEITYNRANHYLITDSISLIPTLDKQSFSQKLGRQVDRIKASISNVYISDFDINILTPLTITGQKFAMSFFVQAYRDKSFPYTKSSISPLPAEMIAKFKGIFSFDTLMITDSYAEYEERMQPERAPGLVFFNIDTVFSTQLNNKSDRSNLDFKVISRPMGVGLLKFNFNIPIQGSTQYALQGNLTNLELSKMNSILKSSTLMEFTAGKVNKMDFSFQYDDARSWGNLSLDLDTIALQVFKKKSPDKRSLIKTLILRDVLDDKIKNPHQLNGIISFERDRRRSVFNFWWKSLLSGFKQAMGVDQKSIEAANDE